MLRRLGENIGLILTGYRAEGVSEGMHLVFLVWADF